MLVLKRVKINPYHKKQVYPFTQTSIINEGNSNQI